MMGFPESIFQPDNDLKHTANVTKQWFAAKDVRLSAWPSQSPDLNPIENLLGFIKLKIFILKPKNLNELKTVIQAVWNSII